RHVGLRCSNTVNDRVGKACKWHLYGVNHIDLCLPFSGDEVRKPLIWTREHPPRWRAHRSPVKEHAKFSLVLHDMRRRKETRAQWWTHRAASGFHGIDRLALKDVFKKIAHGYSARLSALACQTLGR